MLAMQTAFMFCDRLTTYEITKLKMWAICCVKNETKVLYFEQNSKYQAWNYTQANEAKVYVAPCLGLGCQFEIFHSY